MGARFVRLGIAGFKSFADALSIELLPGLTGIVGPNGCGKSNVGEALRWAMGEANARHLRGGEMDDVIFAGTANRAGRNLAEVSLTVEGDPGAEGALPPPFADRPEVQVTRRIERGSGSGYRINGREARARDVQTLFADLGSGARSSSMISQGRVGLLVNARPEERRAVLEEAAGITGLHTRRSEAEGRLRAAEANLERAEERRVLLERQLEALRGQAKQAARYRVVSEGALEAEAMFLAIQQARTEANLMARRTALDEASEKLLAATAGAASLSAKAVDIEASVPAYREAETVARVALERARAVQAATKADAAQADALLAAARQRAAQLGRDLLHAQSTVRDAEQADARLIAEATQLEADGVVYPTALLKAQEAVEAASAALQKADLTASETAALAAEATATINGLQQILIQAESRARRASEMRNRVLAERDRAYLQTVDPQRLADTLAESQKAGEALIEAVQLLDRAESERARTALVAARNREAHAKADAARQKVAAETSALADVLAVKDGERWPPLIDSLDVPPGLEAALGAALGEELAAAGNPAAARHWRPMPSAIATPEPGTPLSKTVRPPPLLERAIGAIGVVATDAEGDAGQSLLLPGQSLVSQQGAVWRWDGYTIRAGTPTAAAVRLQQRNRLAALRTRLGAVEQEAREALAARATASSEERAAADAEQSLRSARRQAEQRAAAERTRALALAQQSETTAARVTVLDGQLSDLEPEASLATEALAMARAQHAAAPDPVALRRQAEAARQAVTSARQADSAAGRTLDALQRAEHVRTARLVTIVRERDDRRLRVQDLIGRVSDLMAREIETSAEVDKLSTAPEQLAWRMDDAERMLRVAADAHRDAVEALRLRDLERTAASADARAAELAVFSLREALVRAEGAAAAAEQAAMAMGARLAEREQSLPAVAVPVDMSPAAEERMRHRLQRLLRERDEIGPVNLRAEIEAGAIEGEIATIMKEREELGTAISKLRGGIGHLNREGRERLTAIFQAVDRHFQTLFARMFGGGRAHLAMVGSDDPLEAGLEIYAQPPGKKLTSLSLLSGGEQALTALSLIFAVFRCNPSPLCVLDEVDAPLDDANVERVCALLSDMAADTGTRFLVVTHHQVTMSRMDRLYGVTMQERGISRVLSVNLSDAVEMIDAAAAE